MRSKTIGLLLSALALANVGFAIAQTGKPQRSGVTFKTLYNFTGGEDGCCLYGSLTRDLHGDLYGLAYADGSGGYGDLYRLTRTKSGYKLRVLQAFSWGSGECMSTPVIDKSGNVFGVCNSSGYSHGWLWEYSAEGKFINLVEFNGPGNGMEPEDGLVLDNKGNIYGTTYTWGAGGSGTLWKYSLRSKTLTVLHAFSDGDDGALLPASPNLDPNGVLWGTTEFGPNCYYCGSGTVWSYDLSSGTFTTVLDFGSSGILAPQSRLVIGPRGNLFGTAFDSSSSCGLVYELQKDKGYAPIVVYEFDGTNDGCGPFGRVRLNKQGHFLGTTYDGGDFGYGMVYELVHQDGGWQETILHSFDVSDGWRPQSGLITDHKGNWFGTTSLGGKYSWGTIFEISGIYE